MKTFDDKVAAITGAASGIGKSLAIELVKRNCNVALSDVDVDGLARTVTEIKSLNLDIQVTSALVNVADRESMHQWADQVAKEHGKVNLIFNNAGVALGGTVQDTAYSDYEWIVGINMWGVLYGTKAFLPYIKQANEEGHIINISSVFGLFSQPTQSGYNMSKFAVRGFTESLRQELDIENGNISVTSIHPGGIKTNIARNARMSTSIENLTGEATSENMRNKFESLFLTTPEQAAKTILKGVLGNKRRVLVGPDAIVLDLMQRSMPVAYQKIVTSSFQWVGR